MSRRTALLLITPIVLVIEFPVLHFFNNMIGILITAVMSFTLFIFIYFKFTFITSTKNLVYQFNNNEEITLHLTYNIKTLRNNSNSLWPYINDTNKTIKEIKDNKENGLKLYKNIKRIILTSHLITPKIAKRYNYKTKKESLLKSLLYLIGNFIVYCLVNKSIKIIPAYVKGNLKRGLYTIQIDI